jgi:hypothetical protein
VIWLGTTLPRKLENREILAAGPNSRNLSLSLLLSQVNGQLICVVSNPVDQKNATIDLESQLPMDG